MNMYNQATVSPPPAVFEARQRHLTSGMRERAPIELADVQVWTDERADPKGRRL